ncbi:hypothetical protein MKY84_04400 [Chryseomicrobium sp. FSL W7-1435]|uniref:hypothetical protein n=1 Tax=Chryseomicrobium sp. FSL W7-1435 TaxID=2921704 RepID=UPI00315AD252
MKQLIIWIVILALLFTTAFVYNEQIGSIPLLILALFLFAIWLYLLKSKKRTKR